MKLYLKIAIVVIALVVVILFGVAKEVYDYKSYGLFDYKDMIATISGGIILLLTQLFFICYFHYSFLHISFYLLLLVLLLIYQYLYPYQNVF